VRRRELMVLLGSAMVACSARAPYAAKIYRIGFLWDGPAVFPEAMEAFRQGLRDLGYVEGRTIAIEYRWTEGKPERP
jgi:putative ABC transport system substrate-binding protein